MNWVPAHGAVFGAEDGAAVGLAQQLDVLQAEEEAVGGGAGEDEWLGRRLGLLLTIRLSQDHKIETSKFVFFKNRLIKYRKPTFFQGYFSALLDQ